MSTPRLRCLSIALAIAFSEGPTSPQAAQSHPQVFHQVPMLSKTCLITSNVRRLVDFYEPILNLKATWSGKDYAEFPTGVGVLAIFSVEAQENYIPGASEAANNKSMVLEFRVDDVDREYRRLEGLVKTWVKPPTTQPWGTRSVYFRDPDGNLVDFYTPPKAQE